MTSTPEQIYRTFIAEEADASRQRNRLKTPFDISNAWMGLLMAWDASRFNEVVDVASYTENCLGLTGWTTGFDQIGKYFLEKPEKQIPLATANVGYHPGETR